MRRLRLSIAWILAASLAAASPVSGEEPTAVETPWLRSWFPAMRQEMEDLPPFFRDTKLNLHLRTFYLNRTSTTPCRGSAKSTAVFPAFTATG